MLSLYYNHTIFLMLRPYNSNWHNLNLICVQVEDIIEALAACESCELNDTELFKAGNKFLIRVKVTEEEYEKESTKQFIRSSLTLLENNFQVFLNLCLAPF